MTTSLDGHWLQVDGRRDWIPDDQPPSPDGTPGTWHIVGASGEMGEWEWHPAPPPVVPSRPSVFAHTPFEPPTAELAAEVPVRPSSSSRLDADRRPLTASDKPPAQKRERRRTFEPSDVSRRLRALADGDAETPGARRAAWNSWRRIGRIFVWWLLFTTIYGVLLGIAGLLWSVDRDVTDGVARGFAWAALVAAVPAALTFVYGVGRLIPQLFHVTGEIEQRRS